MEPPSPPSPPSPAKPAAKPRARARANGLPSARVVVDAQNRAHFPGYAPKQPKAVLQMIALVREGAGRVQRRPNSGAEVDSKLLIGLLVAGLIKQSALFSEDDQTLFKSRCSYSLLATKLCTLMYVRAQQLLAERGLSAQLLRLHGYENAVKGMPHSRGAGLCICKGAEAVLGQAADELERHIRDNVDEI